MNSANDFHVKIFSVPPGQGSLHPRLLRAMQRYLSLQHSPQGQYLGTLQFLQNSAGPQLDSAVSHAGGLQISELTLHYLQSSIGVEGWNGSSGRYYSSLALGLYQDPFR